MVNQGWMLYDRASQPNRLPGRLPAETPNREKHRNGLRKIYCLPNIEKNKTTQHCHFSQFGLFSMHSGGRNTKKQTANCMYPHKGALYLFVPGPIVKSQRQPGLVKSSDLMKAARHPKWKLFNQGTLVDPKINPAFYLLRVLDIQQPWFQKILTCIPSAYHQSETNTPSQ